MTDLNQARTQANALISKALADEEFRSKLKSEPMDTMKAEGIDEKLAEEIGLELRVDGEPIITGCLYTCHFLSSVTMA